MPKDTLADLKIRSPKLQGGRDRWYRYYAGFEPTFVDDVVVGLYAEKTDVDVLDPWMGSGTTLSVAAGHGHHVHGIDLNPAMIVVAKGRLLAEDTLQSVAALTREIVNRWGESDLSNSDPLSQWFDTQSAARIRSGANVIDTLLSDPTSSVDDKVNGMSSLAALFSVALFESVGHFLRSYASRNPTWIKSSEVGAGEVSVDLNTLKVQFEASVERLVAHLVSNGAVDTATRDHATIALGDSRRLLRMDKTISATITSPPYLTRLDYVIGHLPELAVLGVGSADIVSLRQKMIGTPTMGAAKSSLQLGATTDSLLARISAHAFYAARNYYEPNFRQYFDGMADSISELNRVTRDDGDLLFVVQDSWFKGIHLDLASCVTDVAAQFGWHQVGKRDFVGVRSMVTVNPHATEEAKRSKPVESLIHLRK